MRYDSPFFDVSSPSLTPGARADETTRDRTVRPVRRVIDASVTMILDGLAAYGEAMYPSFFELGEYIYDRGDGMRTPYGRSVFLHEEERPLAAPVERTEQAARSDHRWTMWPLGWLWSSLRNAYRRRQTRATLEALDDQALHDIGLNRGQIDHIVTHENLYS